MVVEGKQPNEHQPVQEGIHGKPDTAYHPGTCHTDRPSGNTDIIT